MLLFEKLSEFNPNYYIIQTKQKVNKLSDESHFAESFLREGDGGWTTGVGDWTRALCACGNLSQRYGKGRRILVSFFSSTF